MMNMNRRDLLKAAIAVPLAATPLLASQPQLTTTTPDPSLSNYCGSCGTYTTRTTTIPPWETRHTTYVPTSTTTTTVDPSVPATLEEFKSALQRYFALSGMIFTDEIWNEIISS